MDTAKLNVNVAFEKALDSAFLSFKRVKGSLPRQLVIGCSGGMDSMALLHLVNNWQKNAQSHVTLHLIHVNHQLSPNANAWQAFVSEQASSLGLQYSISQVDINQRSRTSLEEQARDARYAAFAEHCDDDSLLLLAHHQWDQIETVFLRLFRGSGPKGLSAMSAFTLRNVNDSKLSIARPLLSIGRDALEEYANLHALQWVEDESNQDTRFDRNNVRNNLLTAIRDHWPARWQGMFSAISRSATLCDNQQQVLKLLCDDKLQQITVQPVTLSRRLLLDMPTVVRAELLRQWLVSLRAPIPSAAILAQVLNALESDTDKQPLIQWQNTQIRMHADWVYAILKPFADGEALDVNLVNQQPVQWRNPWGEAVSISISEQQMIVKASNSQRANAYFQLSSHKQSPSIILRSNIQAVRLRLNEKQKVRPLKHWLKEWQVAPWYRSNVLGVFVNDAIVAVYDGLTLMPVLAEQD